MQGRLIEVQVELGIIQAPALKSRNGSWEDQSKTLPSQNTRQLYGVRRLDAAFLRRGLTRRVDSGT